MRNIGLYLLICFLILQFTACTEEEKKPGSVYGVITDKATGEPIRSAGVQLSPLGIKTVTGSEGQYEFMELEEGSYALYVSKTGYSDLNGHSIHVIAGQTIKGDVQIEKLPPSLRVVNDNKQDISNLEFGLATDDVTRSFSIFNDGTEALEWEISKNSEWITKISKTNGMLNAGATQAIIVTIDRDQLSGGVNTTTIHITSNNGSKNLTITAAGVEKRLPTLNTLDVTDIGATKVTFNGKITYTGIPLYTERGFVYSTSSMPTIDNTIAKLTVAVTNDKEYTAQATGLTFDKTYYVRAYAVNSAGIAYSSNEVSFTTTTIADYIVLQTDGIMVQKYDISSGADWNTANTLCENSTVGGYNNWRLPTKGELQSLYGQKTSVGNFTTDNYWTSTVASTYYTAYSVVYFANGSVYSSTPSSTNRVRAVRTLP
ncbi:DUF1566 domain-containing protein [Bacteroides sp. 519]|uniref:Lcl domain-containing protein n=1 Tax=Bacteroides sp. 519 TaxID=2302937 RepID=UPI0013D513C1|nr:DUF1566 domain-containing protein [Bacteroides sp. 519]NDV59252.1 DUF1566 domain-containing protein [Bacteroides sp. 519]